jgi:hypothetical protein
MMELLRERERKRDQRAALICCQIVNMLRDPKSPAASIDDFMPTYGDVKESMTDEQMLDQVVALNVAFGGDVN